MNRGKKLIRGQQGFRMFLPSDPQGLRSRLLGCVSLYVVSFMSSKAAHYLQFHCNSLLLQQLFVSPSCSLGSLIAQHDHRLAAMLGRLQQLYRRSHSLVFEDRLAF